MVSGASQIDGRSAPIDQLTSPTNYGAWGVAIVGNFVFPPSCGTPKLPQGVPSHQLLPVGCPSVGNPPPQLFPLPGTHPSCLPSLSPLCMYLSIANIFDL